MLREFWGLKGERSSCSEKRTKSSWKFTLTVIKNDKLTKLPASRRALSPITTIWHFPSREAIWFSSFLLERLKDKTKSWSSCKSCLKKQCNQWNPRQRNKVTNAPTSPITQLDELISRVCAKLEIRVKDLMSKSRKRCLSQARGVVCYLAVDELGYRGDDVARILRISGRGVSDCRERGREILDKPEIIGEYLV